MRTLALARLSLLFKRIERAHELELAIAAGSAIAAEAAVAEHVQSCRQINDEQRHALARADGAERHLLQAAHLCAVRVRPLLETEQILADARRDEAAKIQRQSRLESERLIAVLDRARAEERVVESRRTQAQMDDRFAARAAWRKAQEETQDA